MYKKTTQIPNVLLDHYLPDLSVAELKILLVILRQTNGWIDKHTKSRKTRDRISHSQFIEKTGLSRRIISQTISKLQGRGLIAVTDHTGRSLIRGSERSGRTHIFYSSICALPDTDLCTLRHQPVQKGAYNKTNYTKLNILNDEVPTLFNLKPIKELIESAGYKEKDGS
ncbi:MAG: replication protein [Nitrososphaerales archaeon]